MRRACVTAGLFDFVLPKRFSGIPFNHSACEVLTGICVCARAYMCVRAYVCVYVCVRVCVSHRLSRPSRLMPTSTVPHPRVSCVSVC